jgi:ABC-2 type transport system ATP-binding protein
MIEATELSKHFGSTIAVDRLSFTVQPGVVTGFLGPNGAGKSTTMRCILGLDRPTGGGVTVHGRRYVDLPAPMREVGALLDARAVDGVRTARAHLNWMAQAGGIPVSRVDQVLDMVGLTEVASKRVGGFSLGMFQRLGIASAMLGDPPVLLFDEPVNGLDPEGIRWVRMLMRHLASEGRTILVSSHLMSELESTADHVLVIGRGQLLADTTLAELTRNGAASNVRVVAPRADELARLLESHEATVTSQPDGALQVVGLTNTQIGDLAAGAGLALHELTPQRASLESVFIELTEGSVDYRAREEGAA